MSLDGILVGWAVMPEIKSKADHMHMHQIKGISVIEVRDSNLKKARVCPGNQNQF